MVLFRKFWLRRNKIQKRKQKMRYLIISGNNFFSNQIVLLFLLLIFSHKYSFQILIHFIQYSINILLDLNKIFFISFIVIIFNPILHVDANLFQLFTLLVHRVFVIHYIIVEILKLYLVQTTFEKIIFKRWNVIEKNC